MAISRAFGIVLRQLREKRGLSQEALALQCGLDRTYVSLLERGLRQPSLKTVFALAESLNVKASRFVRDVEAELNG